MGRAAGRVGDPAHRRGLSIRARHGQRGGLAEFSKIELLCSEFFGGDFSKRIKKDDFAKAISENKIKIGLGVEEIKKMLKYF